MVALAVAAAVVAVWGVWWLRKRGRDRDLLGLRGALARLIERRLGGYRQQINEIDRRAPLNTRERRRVLVIGGGLAGIGAASQLADRGFVVTLADANPYLGGKIGAWTENGRRVEHGFHAFFRHYYNLNRFLERTGVRANMVPIADYAILERDGRSWTFKDVEPTPGLNLVALARAGLYRLRDILFTPAVHEMDAFLAYDDEATHADLDGVSYAEFAERLQLPARLMLVFNTFARAFFATSDRLSMAELVKAFHFYYLSHDHGLMYDHPVGDYQTSVLRPLRAHLARQGVTVRLGTPIDRIERDGRGFRVAGEHYEYVVLAASPPGTRSILRRSPELLRSAPRLGRQLAALRPSQRYAVLRLWLDRDVRGDLPVFIATERERVLDAIALVHRVSPEVCDEAASVIELHAYAVPDDVADDEVRAAFMQELAVFLPELAGAEVIAEDLQLRADFAAFHVDAYADRPGVQTDVDGLYLAGDWVRLSFPAMLMEGAYSAGLVSANAILRREGLREAPVYSVPRRGLLADVRAAKLARRKRQPERLGATAS